MLNWDEYGKEEVNTAAVVTATKPVIETPQAAEQQRLAGKFDSAEELEKAYIELQKKLGAPKEDEPEVQQEG